MNIVQPLPDIRAAAISAGQRGLRVFPCGPPTAAHEHAPGQYPEQCARCAADKRAKAPWPGWKWADRNSRVPAVIREHWPCLPDGANYGVPAKPNDLVIIDCDRPKPGYAFPPEWQAEPGITDGADVLATLAERAGREWPCTYTVRTPGGGLHLYFAAVPGRPIGNRPMLGPMIDIRGGGGNNGGYVVGPGSVIGGRAYVVTDACAPVPLPAWIAELLDPPRTVPAQRLRSTGGTAVYGRLQGVVERLLSAGPGDRRNSLLHWGACRAAEMVAAGDLDPAKAEDALYRAAEANGHVAKHGERATRATIASGMSQGVAA